MGTFFGLMFLCVLVRMWASKQKAKQLDKLKYEDPERWARVVAAEDARKRAVAGGAIKAVKFLLKK